MLNYCQPTDIIDRIGRYIRNPQHIKIDVIGDIKKFGLVKITGPFLDISYNIYLLDKDIIRATFQQVLLNWDRKDELY